MRKTKKDLFDVLKALITTDNKIRELFGECEILGYEISDLAIIILEQYGLSKYDYAFDLMMNFGDGEITKEKLISELKSFKE